MTYINKYQDDLEKIIKLINEDNESQAIQEFSIYVNNLDIGRYSNSNWNYSWRKKIYDFGELFTKKDAGGFINVIEDFLKVNKDDSKKEAVEFIYSEIIWNYFEQGNLYVASFIKDLIKRYPTNPEFHNAYSFYLEKNDNFDLSLDEACLAFKMDNNNETLKTIGFNKAKNYFNYLVLKGKIDKAKKVLNKMNFFIKDKNKDHVFNNIIISLKDRLSDHEMISERISNIESIAQKAIDKERGKVIEIMGFFVAILGFVFINVNLFTESSLTLKDRLLLMGGMAIILAFFATLISVLFSPKKEIKFNAFLEDKRILIIFFIMGSFILLYKALIGPN